MMTVLLSLTDYEAILIHAHAVASYESCVNMAEYFERGNIPPFARIFYEEAAEWRKIGLRIEAQKPDLHPGSWGD